MIVEWVGTLPGHFRGTSREAVMDAAADAYALWADEPAPDDFEALIARYGFRPQPIGWLGAGSVTEATDGTFVWQLAF